MDIKEWIQKAKEKSELVAAQKKELFYQQTVAWLCYLGLLHHNKIEGRRHSVTLRDALNAGELEPRILELLPAILIVMPKALIFDKSDLPKDLDEILKHIRERRPRKDFRGIPTHQYLHWLKSPMIDIAKRRLNFHRKPRHRINKTHSIGDIVRQGRFSLSLTQKQLAKKFNLSLRVIRDLEQGKLNASLKATNEILQVFGRSLRA